MSLSWNPLPPTAPSLCVATQVSGPGTGLLHGTLNCWCPGVAIASGVYWYLRYFCNAQATWGEPTQPRPRRSTPPPPRPRFPPALLAAGHAQCMYFCMCCCPPPHIQASRALATTSCCQPRCPACPPPSAKSTRWYVLSPSPPSIPGGQRNRHWCQPNVARRRTLAWLRSSWQRFRYYMNVCTVSYSMAYGELAGFLGL
jgi:hypothetical protein